MSFEMDYSFDWDELYYCIVKRTHNDLFFISYGNTKKEAREMALKSPYCTTTQGRPYKYQLNAIMTCDINRPVTSLNGSVYEMGYCEAKLVHMCMRYGFEGIYIWQDVNYSEPLYRFERYYRTRKGCYKQRVRNRTKNINTSNDCP